jgi:hypothetical protein
MAGKIFQCGRGSNSFSSLVVSPPPALEVTGDLDEEESRDGRMSYDLGAGPTGFDGGIDERLREEGLFASLSSPFSGNSEVTRELY